MPMIMTASLKLSRHIIVTNLLKYTGSIVTDAFLGDM